MVAKNIDPGILIEWLRLALGTSQLVFIIGCPQVAVLLAPLQLHLQVVVAP